MSEEINKHAAELNAPPRLSDAELEGVSGGARDSAVIHAKSLCGSCSYRGAGCKGGQSQLAEYMERHGAISWFDKCPFTPYNYK